MAKVIIIGCGGVGTVVAHKCAQHPEVFSEIVIVSRTLDKCRKVVDAIGKPYVSADRVDADNVDELVELLRRHKPAMVINVALPYQDLTIMEACLQCGVNYLDTANYEPRDVAKFEYKWQWAYQDRFKQAGLYALLGSGFDPGVTNVYTAWALKHHFDEIEYLDIIDVNGETYHVYLAGNDEMFDLNEFYQIGLDGMGSEWEFYYATTDENGDDIGLGDIDYSKSYRVEKVEDKE